MSTVMADRALGRLEIEGRAPVARRTVTADRAAAVMAVDVTGRVIYVNASMESFSGRARQDLLDLPLSSVFGPGLSGAGRTAVAVARRAMAENRWACLLEGCLLSSDEPASQAMEFHAAPVRARDGTVTGAVLVFCEAGV